jgi:hypothetical protein
MNQAVLVRGVVFLAVVCLSSEAIAQAQVPTSLAAVSEREQAALVKIEAALAKRVSLDYADVPLQEVIAAEAERAGIPIAITKKIEDAGVQRVMPVSVQIKDVSLESALRRLLADLNLTLLIKDEMLLITTVEDAQSPENMVTRVYPVADLVRAADGTYDFDPLCDLIHGSIEPDSWRDGTGPAPIYSIPSSPAIVISQRRDIHQRIEALLVALRRVRELQGPNPSVTKPAVQSTPASKVPVPFRVPTERKAVR